MPKKLKMSFPVVAKINRIIAEITQAMRAMRMRSRGESLGVIARKAGTIAIGSIITNSELAASRTYSCRVMRVPERPRQARLRRAGREYGVAHAMNDFFVRGADRRQHAAELRARGIAFADNKVIRAKPHTAWQGNQLFSGEVVIAALD